MQVKKKKLRKSKKVLVNRSPVYLSISEVLTKRFGAKGEDLDEAITEIISIVQGYKYY